MRMLIVFIAAIAIGWGAAGVYFGPETPVEVAASVELPDNLPEVASHAAFQENPPMEKVIGWCVKETIEVLIEMGTSVEEISAGTTALREMCEKDWIEYHEWWEAY